MGPPNGSITPHKVVYRRIADAIDGDVRIQTFLVDFEGLIRGDSLLLKQGGEIGRALVLSQDSFSLLGRLVDCT